MLKLIIKVDIKVNYKVNNKGCVGIIGGMLTINEVNIWEFRGIRRLKKPIELSNLNVVIGRNNAGKTSVLEALYLLLDDRNYDQVFRDYRISRIGLLHSGVDSIVYGYSGIARIRCKIDGYSIEKHISNDGKCELYINEEVVGHDYRKAFSNILRLSEEDVSNYTFYISSNTEDLKSLYEWLRNNYSKISKHGLHSKLVRDFINLVVNDNFTEILPFENRLRLRKEVNKELGPIYVDLTDVGDGIERVLSIALTIEYLRPKLLLWDDIEISAHPGLIRQVIKWLSSRDWQIVVTTHSIDVLRELVWQNPSNTNIIILRKNEVDEVEPIYLSIDELEDLLEKRHIDVRGLIETLQL